MSISSNAFGRVELTGEDARKFEAQVRYGRANAASRHAVSEGVKLANKLSENGSVTIKLAKAIPAK